MTNSMTGFGRGRAESEHYGITVEMKSVNHRFMEIYTKLPRSLALREDALKKQVQAAFARGKFDVFVTFEYLSSRNSVVKVDEGLAVAYYQALQQIAAACGIPDHISLSQVASNSGVLTLDTADDDEGEIDALLAEATAGAIAAMQDMRAKEGEALEAELISRVEKVAERVEVIAGYAPNVVAEQRQRLEQRIRELLDNIAVDQDRLANELAFFADKVDITEELTRLRSHIAQFTASFSLSEPIGRKLEFILQEMLRETNTIGSKSNALDINKQVIEVKSELEKIREQIQNVE